MPVDNDEDLLDLFASVALISLAARIVNKGENADAISRMCYIQAQSMLKVRQEFLKDQG